MKLREISVRSWSFGSNFNNDFKLSIIFSLLAQRLWDVIILLSVRRKGKKISKTEEKTLVEGGSRVEVSARLVGVGGCLYSKPCSACFFLPTFVIAQLEAFEPYLQT